MGKFVGSICIRAVSFSHMSSCRPPLKPGNPPSPKRDDSTIRHIYPAFHGAPSIGGRSDFISQTIRRGCLSEFEVGDKHCS